MAPTRGWDADEAVSQLYAAHYAQLVKLAALLVRTSGEAEEIVQDAFVALHGRWGRLREPDRALGYLRTAVVNAARSGHRRHQVAERHRQAARADLSGVAHPSAEDAVVEAARRDTVLAALQRLPDRQREVLVLRYYADLSEADIAHTLGISRGAVKSHASRGAAALRASLEEHR